MIILIMPGYPGAVSWVRKNGREIFLKTGERAPGIILLTNLFHGSFECLSVIVFCAQSEAIIYPATFVIL